MTKGLSRVVASFLLAIVCTGAAHGAQVGRDADLRRTGWYPDQSGLTPAVVSGSSFGQRFSTPVTGLVLAQPLVSGGTLLVVTEANWIYGLDPVTGAIQWSRQVATPVNATDIAGCEDIFPTVGITSTPVIDSTGIAYFTSKQYVAGSSGATAWKIHAVSMSTGAEQAGFPVTIQGSANNVATQTFSPNTLNQRPGLLLLDGVVYAAFGAACDTPPYQGWVAGVTTSGTLRNMWVDRSGTNLSGGGIWMSGSALVSDGPGQILLVTGNGAGGGTPVAPGPGTSPPVDLGESVVRLTVQPGGALQATDYFTTWNAASYLDPIDGDVGSGGVVGLPYPQFGTATYSNLYVQVGKEGTIFLLDGNSLGGYQQGAGGTDKVLQKIGPYGGVWSKPTVWGGDGGWVYIPEADTVLAPGESEGYLRAYQAGVDGSGKPTLTLAGTSTEYFGFASSSPVVTSSGTTSGSALLWIIRNPDYTGVGAELRAYDVLPVSGKLHLRFSAPVGTGSKFNPPGVAGNRLYVGTRDGHVLGFGLPAGAGVAGDPAPSAGARLGAAYPNPFAGATTMELALARSGPVNIAVFDASGRQVRRLVDGDAGAGSQHVVWDGRNDAGARVPAGLYLVRMRAAGTRQAQRVMVVR